VSAPDTPKPEPGERPPAARLSRPPSSRYQRGGSVLPEAGRRGASTGSADDRSEGGRASARGPILAAAVVAVLGAAAISVTLEILLLTSGTIALSAVAGGAIGLLVAGAAVTRPAGGGGRQPPALDRGQAVRVAVSIGVGMVVLGGVLAWLIARGEGGVLDPATYLWTTYGFGIPIQAVVAALAAAWGAASGPIRWRG
jgi:hypothetical protein